MRLYFAHQLRHATTWSVIGQKALSQVACKSYALSGHHKSRVERAYAHRVSISYCRTVRY